VSCRRRGWVPAFAGTTAWLTLALLALAVLPGAVGAVTWDPQHEGLQPVPALSTHVTDLTGTLSASERQALEAKLADWEAKTTNQLAVLIVPTTKPETIEEYSIRVAEAWKTGQKGKDNGALFLVAKNDKQMRIEVGYGLEGELTDVASRRIIGDTVAPLFSNGQFAAGINAGVDRIMAVVGGSDTAPPPPPRRSRSSHFDFGTIAILLLVAVPALGAVLRSVFGNVGGSVAGGAIAGGVTWLVAGSILFGVVAAILALVVIAFSSFGGRGGPGMWFPGGGGGWGGGGFGSGGGWGGGGGGFGGGGASGGWR
jgi:uncharacterized protein